MLTYTSVFIVIVCACIGLYLLYSHRRTRRHLQEMHDAIGFLEHATQLLQHLPQHRGMANALLNGDASFKDKLTEMRDQIGRDADQLDQFCSSHPIAPQSVSDWHSIKAEWGELKQQLTQLSPAASFERHTVLINRLLNLISDSSDHMKLSSHPDHHIRQLVDSAFKRLPPIIERIGQARGIGSGAAAKGKLLTAVRIKLRFLHQNLEHGVSQTYQHLRQQLQQANALDSGNIEATHQLSQQFLATLDNKLLGAEVTTNAADFFAAGSQALDDNLKLMTRITGVLKTHIGQQLGH